jgi:hypothetical protein
MDLNKSRYSLIAVAGYAVDGNTDGEFLNSSTTHTNDEQGAWWQVDLFFGIRCDMKILLIGVGTEVCFIRNSNLVIA